MDTKDTSSSPSMLSGIPYMKQAVQSYPGVLGSQWIGGANGGDAILPIGIFATLHAMRIAYEIRKMTQLNGRRPMMQEMATMLTFSFGGAILTALALGRTQPWLENNTTVPVYAAVYLLMSRMPGDLLFKFLRYTSPVSDVFLAGVDGLLRGYGVTAAGVDLVRHTMKGYPVSDSLVAWILMGTVLGSGGGIIDDFLQISQAVWGFRTPSMLTNGLSLDVKLSFGATVGYILTTHAWSFAEHAPGFPLSSLLDTLLKSVPQLEDQEAHLISGLMCAAVLSTAAHANAQKYATAERTALADGRRKKNDDEDADVDSEDSN